MPRRPGAAAPAVQDPAQSDPTTAWWMDLIGHDGPIRRQLKADVAMASPDALLVDELPVVYSRADLVALSPAMVTGFEIKAWADSVRRLPQQVVDYGRLVDRAILVTTMNHIDAAERLLPSWWGIWIATPYHPSVGSGHGLIESRPASDNPGAEPAILAGLLWRTELLESLARLDALTGIRSKPNARLAAALAERLERPALRTLVHDTLRARTQWRDADGRAIGFPDRPGR